MEALLETVQDQAEEGEFDDLNDIMGEMGARPEELYWKEADDGSLLVGDSDRNPETVARIVAEDGSLSAEIVDELETPWRSPFLSSPTDRVEERQFD